MNINDLKKIKEKLDKEYQENNNRIGEISKKINILNENNLENKILRSIVFSTIPFTVLIFSLPTIINLNIIPINLIQPLFVSIPVALGIIIEKISAKKDDFSFFPKFKKQQMVIEEITRDEIEKEKLTQLNIVLKRAYTAVVEKENSISNLKDDYEIIEKEKDTRNKKEIESDIKNINSNLKTMIQKLYVKATQNVLKNKFAKIRNKFDKYVSIFTNSMIGGTLCMIIFNMPIIYLNQLKSIQIQNSLLNILAPLFIGSVVCGEYFIKREHDYTTTFNKINNELGNDSLSKFDDDDLQLDKDLEKIIDEIYTNKLKLEVEKTKLENINKSFDKKTYNENEIIAESNYYFENNNINKGKSLVLSKFQKK